MKKTTGTLLFVLIALLIAGCASTQEARLYILDTPLSAPESNPSSTSEKTPIINIASIQIPDHLSRPVVITKVAENELAFSDFHRWAGPLQSNIRQVLVENLSIILQSDRIFADPRKQSFPADYHLEIAIFDLTGILGETATLQARWSIFSTEGEEIVALDGFRKTIDIGGKSRRDYVNAQSELLVLLSRAIAASLPEE